VPWTLLGTNFIILGTEDMQQACQRSQWTVGDGAVTSVEHGARKGDRAHSSFIGDPLQAVKPQDLEDHRMVDFLLRRDEDGQGLAEYALILALIAIIAITALIFLGGQIADILSQIGAQI
jgi:pilus assembly protein Flp/PilA